MTRIRLGLLVGAGVLPRGITMKMSCVLTAVLAALILMPGLVQARSDTDVGYRGWGPRVGLTVGPDQIHFGAHVDFGNFARHVRFQPNLELGLGDHVTLVAINLEAAYRFQSRWDVWTPYLGGGLGLNFGDDDGGHGWRGRWWHDNSNTDIGLNILGGVEKGLRSGDRFFAEAKLGFAGSPNLKLTFGWTFFP